MASIAVPTGNVYPSYHHYNNNDGFHNYSLGRGGNQVMPDLGPPYIVKLLQLPITVNEAFIEDLFRSRYTTFVKFKIVVDPSSNILETKVIKKVAFVELANFSDFQKVSKWQDLYYKQNRRVVIEMADFNDFKTTIRFNEEHQREIAEIEADFNSNKNNPRFQDGGLSGSGDRYSSRPGGVRSDNLRALQSQPPLKSPTLQQLQIKTPILKPKPNPFGNAKPVDTLSKQQEIEKKLINLNKTTVQTLGDDIENVDIETTIKKFHESASPRYRRGSFEGRRLSFSILKRPTDLAANLNNLDSSNTNNHTTPDPLKKDFDQPKKLNQSKVSAVPGTQSLAVEESNSKKLSPAPVPEYAYLQNTSGKSLAELLAEKPDSNSNGKGVTRTEKKPAPKPIILKKKVLSQPEVDLTRKESDLLAEEEYRKRDEALRKIENERRKLLEEELKKQRKEEEERKKVELEDKLKLINESLLKADTEEKKNVEKRQNGELVDLRTSVNKVNSAGDRPDFKKRLNEIVNKREKDATKDGKNTVEAGEYSNKGIHNGRGGYSSRGGYGSRGRYYKNSQYDLHNNNRSQQQSNGSTERSKSSTEQKNDVKIDGSGGKVKPLKDQSNHEKNDVLLDTTSRANGILTSDLRENSKNTAQPTTSRYGTKNKSKVFNKKTEATLTQVEGTDASRKTLNSASEPNATGDLEDSLHSKEVQEQKDKVVGNPKSKLPKKEKLQKPQQSNTNKENKEVFAEESEPSIPKKFESINSKFKKQENEIKKNIGKDEVIESEKGNQNDSSNQDESAHHPSPRGGRGRAGFRGNYRGRYAPRARGGMGSFNNRGRGASYNLLYVRVKRDTEATEKEA